MFLKFLKYLLFRLAYVIALFLAALGMQAPTLSYAKEISTGIFVLLFIPCVVQLLVSFWRVLPLASKVYRNHPQWGGSRDRDY